MTNNTIIIDNNYNSEYINQIINTQDIIVKKFIDFLNDKEHKIDMRDFILAEIDYYLWITYPYNGNYVNYVDNIMHYRNIIFDNDDLDKMNNFLNEISHLNRNEIKNIFNNINFLYR